MDGEPDIQKVLLDIQATRFVSAAGVVILLYDHLLTFDDEVKYIWYAPGLLPKRLFLVIRYVVPVALVLQLVQMSGLSTITLSDKFCAIWMSFAMYLGLITMAISNFLILLRLSVLWDRSRAIMYWTMSCFVITQLATLSYMVYSAIQMQPILKWEPSIRMCVFAVKIKVVGLWAPGLVFETMVFILTCWNALRRPRVSDNELTRSLYRDGFVYFIILFVLRLTNVVLAIIAPVSLLFIVIFFVWCSTTVTTTRFVLNVRKLSAREESRAYESAGGENDGDDDDDDDDENSPRCSNQKPSHPHRTHTHESTDDTSRYGITALRRSISESENHLFGKSAADISYESGYELTYYGMNATASSSGH